MGRYYGGDRGAVLGSAYHACWLDGATHQHALSIGLYSNLDHHGPIIAVFIAFEITTWSETWHGVISAWPEILFAGVMSTGLGFTLQLIAQQHCSNAAAAIILSLEGVFAAAAGWIILGQSMMVSAMIGAGFIFIAVLIVECTPEKRVAKQK